MPVDQAPLIAWRAIAPALSLAIGSVVTLMLGAINPRTKRAVFLGLSLATIGVASYFTFSLAHERIVGMQGTVASDGVALFTNLILLFSLTIALLVSYHYMSARKLHRFEYYSLMLLATAGMVLLAGANDLILVFISIEVLSLALYIMIGIARRDARAQEASLKYFLLGAFSSAILVYGIALLYGATGQTNISALTDRVVAQGVDARLVFAGVGLIFVGFAFKISAVPFHMWTPDAYQVAPTPVTGFMAAATKAAAFAGLLRVALVAFGRLQYDWAPALRVIAIATMVLGSLIALVQTDLKRMLAYSSIAHAGFILAAVVAGQGGVAPALFYLLTYAAMTLGAFAMIAASGTRERLDVGSWQGMGHRHPVFAGAMTLFMLSLAGIPPTAGFMAKFFVFQSAANARETGLVVAGVLTSALAAFFYLRVIVLMWLQDPEEETMAIGVTPAAGLALTLVALVTIAFGVWPQAMMDLARHAAIFTG
ncbi:MAG: NADH-quinone oxidoreductase subunit N [Actinomycetota bacterium]